MPHGASAVTARVRGSASRVTSPGRSDRVEKIQLRIAGEASISGGKLAPVGDGERREECVRQQVAPDAAVLSGVRGEHVPGRRGGRQHVPARGIPQPIHETQSVGDGGGICEDARAGNEGRLR